MENLSPINNAEFSLAELLDQTNWVHDLPWQDIQVLARYFKAYRVAAGATLFEEGEQASSMGLIVAGKIKVIKKGQSGQERILAVMRPSQTFGELSLIDGAPRSATAVAMTDVTLLLTDKDALFNMAEVHPKLAFRFTFRLAQLLSQRLRHTSLQLADSPS
ncbi:Crp/Fnr family transcriptional regulator [Salinibius halmophilus]|uniref:Crp/Fnr family transcriptional regulator n=1 Tax=Salinibius halmophilus TaxID=1853216 RepID=UPI000E660B55|nr:cyclic nucleotide-binding domain-containing protein [Salinibius halmophilus]